MFQLRKVIQKYLFRFIQSDSPGITQLHQGWGRNVTDAQLPPEKARQMAQCQLYSFKLRLLTLQ